MKIKFARPLEKTLKGKVEKYNFEVGILVDKPHREAQSKSFSSYAGGPIRRQSRDIDGTLSSISRKVRIITGINYLVVPFQSKTTAVQKMIKNFFELCFGENQATLTRRLENSVQAVVRNPILANKYGPNSLRTVKIKGFSRKFIDTGQLFRNINAKVTLTGKS